MNKPNAIRNRFVAAICMLFLFACMYSGFCAPAFADENGSSTANDTMDSIAGEAVADTSMDGVVEATNESDALSLENAGAADLAEDIAPDTAGDGVADVVVEGTADDAIDSDSTEELEATATESGEEVASASDMTSESDVEDVAGNEGVLRAQDDQDAATDEGESDNPSATEPEEEKEDPASVIYNAHVRKIGWQGEVEDGTTSGSDTAGLRIESIKVRLDGVKGSVLYRVYVTGKGWTSYSTNGAMAGTTGKSLAIQAIQAKLTGEASKLYKLYYRVFVDDFGWMGWASNNEATGTVGFDRALEGVQFKLEKKGDAAPSAKDSVTKITYVTTPKVTVQAHVQRKGWMATVGNNVIAGTTGKSLRMEALKISITNGTIKGGATYDAHVQRIGWQDYVSNGKLSGTTGKSLRMEAMNLGLTKDLADCYDVFYRVHVQSYGWLDWAQAMQMAGTEGKCLRLEAVQVYVTLKGGVAPGQTGHPAITTYFYLDAGHGWGNGRPDSGAMSGEYKEATETKELVGKIAEYAVKEFHLQVYDNSDCRINFTGRQADAKSRGCSAFVSIHFNASGKGKGTGTESYAYTSAGKRLQSIIHPFLVEGTGLADRGMMTNNFTVVTGPVPGVLCEICFIDNEKDMEWYKSAYGNQFATREDYIAYKIAEGMLEASKQGF